MNSNNQKAIQPIEKWFTEANPRYKKQLISLGNYLVKIGIDENEVDLIKSRANMMPDLDLMNMKLLARVWIHIIRNKMSPNSNITELNFNGLLSDEDIDNEIRNFFPLEMPKGGKRKTGAYQETLLNELRATWLRYMEKCLPYSDVWNESIESAAYRVASIGLPLKYDQGDSIDNILTFTPSEISSKIDSLLS